MADQVLDVTGLNCPLPILKTKIALKSLADGQTLEILSTDPSSVVDFGAFCRATGNELLQLNEQDGVLTYLIRKKAQ